MEAEEEQQTTRLEDIKYYTSLLLGQEQQQYFSIDKRYHIKYSSHAKFNFEFCPITTTTLNVLS